MSIALTLELDLTSTANGAFFPACLIHTAFSPLKPIIGGLSYLQAMGNFYFNRTGPAGYKLQDDCGIMCGDCP